MRLLDSFFHYVIVVLGGTIGVSPPPNVSPGPSPPPDPPANSASTNPEAGAQTPDQDLQLPNPYGSANPYGPTNPYLIDPQTQAAPTANGANQTAYPQGDDPSCHQPRYL